MRFFSSDLPEHTVLTMPALSPTMEKGNIVEWMKKVGDKVPANQTLAQVETDKAVIPFDSVDSGYLAKILVDTGVEVDVGVPVAILVEEQKDVAAFKDYKTSGGGGEAKPAEPAKKEEEQSKSDKSEEKPSKKSTSEDKSESDGAEEGGRKLASPAARRVASEKGVALGEVKGTGGSVGRIVAADVLEHTPSKQATTKQQTSGEATGRFVDLPHSGIKKTTAKRLVQSKQTIPHYYLAMDCRVDKLLAQREAFNSKREKNNRLSVNDFVIKAAALALRAVPQLNSQWMDNAIRQFDYVDISVAVMTDAGLITPIVFDADSKGLDGISTTVKALGAKAKDGKLKPEEFIGGTFTISNLGMYGITSFSAIINPPQAAILAVGTTTTRIVESGEGRYEKAQYMTVQLSCDHRVVDGAVGAQWLQVFRNLIEDPVTMLL
jgi:pyruvate dehydrogenase E2 component (dihydrolipoamide acetyltransferase)